MKIRLLKQMDRTVGALLARLLGAPRPRPFPCPRNILIIRPGGIGDAVHLVPTIDCIRRAFPGVAIDVLAEKRNAAVFQLAPGVARVFSYDSISGLWHAGRTGYDLVMDSEQWHYLSAVVARLLGGARSIGFATNARAKLFTDTVSYAHDDYEVESFFRLLAPLGVDRPSRPGGAFLAAPAAASRAAAAFLGDLAGRAFVAVFPGASIPERRWGAEKFGALALMLNDRGLPIVVVGGRVDVADGEKITAGRCGLNLAGKTSLAETAAVIEKSALLVSGDSGILHIGVGLGKPTVSLFGPGIARKWAPQGGQHIVINKNLHCSPCTRFGYTPKCTINAKCLADITVDEVVAAVERLLASMKP